MATKIRNWLITLFILASPFVLFLGLLLFWDAEPLPPLAPLPNLNGYNDLVKAGKLIKGDVSDYEKADSEKLRGIVMTNAEALTMARSALSNQCRVPVQYTWAYQSNHLQDLIALRYLAQTLACEGKFAERENRFNDAAKSYLDTIHSGNEAGHGGVVIDEMIGIAIESLGLEQLEKITDRLDAKSCRDTITTLETLAAHRQSWAYVMQTEDAWLRRSYPGLKGHLTILYARFAFYRMRQQNYQRAIDKIISTQKTEGQLLVELATRAYELEKSHPPTSVADLVPDYLKAVPQDPVTGTNLVYSPK